MKPDDNFKEVCTVTEMANRLGLARSRFYQIQRLGVFPPPVYCIRTKRPFYPLDLQRRCIRVRETGIGVNGQLSCFYAPRNKAITKGPAIKSGVKATACYSHLVRVLKDMGIKTSTAEVKAATMKRFPKGLTPDRIDNTVITDLFQHFKSEGKGDV